MDDIVWIYFRSKKGDDYRNASFDKWKARGTHSTLICFADDVALTVRDAKNAATLFVMVADEAHWGITSEGANDAFVNDPDLLKCPNHFLLQVTATPYNLLTAHSRCVCHVSLFTPWTAFLQITY